MNYIQNDLFIKESNINFYQLKPFDAELDSDNFNILKMLVLKHERMYPDIDKWFNEKVKPGIISGERIAFMVFDDDLPIASSVIKLGKSTKFCHLYISSEYQNYNRSIGDLCWSLMVLNAKSYAHEIHFTLPESLWENKTVFFKSWGFTNFFKSPIQYRKFEDELMCSEPFFKVWKNYKFKSKKIISDFTEYPDDIFNGILISIKPKFVEKIKSGEKVIEIRRRFNKKWTGRRATIYASTPVKALYGHAKISNVIVDKPEIIWSNYKNDIGCTEDEFASYINNNSEIFAIALENFEEYTAPVLLTQLNSYTDFNLKPPQSYSSLKKDDKWAEAVSVAELLHSKFKISRNISM